MKQYISWNNNNIKSKIVQLWITCVYHTKYFQDLSTILHYNKQVYFIFFFFFFFCYKCWLLPTSWWLPYLFSKAKTIKLFKLFQYIYSRLVITSSISKVYCSIHFRIYSIMMKSSNGIDDATRRRYQEEFKMLFFFIYLLGIEFSK